MTIINNGFSQFNTTTKRTTSIDLFLSIFINVVTSKCNITYNNICSIDKVLSSICFMNSNLLQ